MNNAYACTTRTSISPEKNWDSHECKLASGGKLMLLSKELIVNVVVNWQCLSRAWINSWRVLQQPVLFGVRIFNVQINIFCSSRIKPFFFSSKRKGFFGGKVFRLWVGWINQRFSSFPDVTIQILMWQPSNSKTTKQVIWSFHKCGWNVSSDKKKWLKTQKDLCSSNWLLFDSFCS